MPHAPLSQLSDAPAGPPLVGSLLRLAWEPTSAERPVGFDPRACYTERFWVPVLGPTATWLVRRFADALDAQPEDCTVDLAEMAAGLGLGWSASTHSPLRRALARCVQHDVAFWSGEGLLSVRQRFPFVPRRLLMRLPLALQAEHRDWVAAVAVADVGTGRRRARLVALELADLGLDDACIERHLLRRGVHPASAFEAARWARNPEVDRMLSG